MIAAPVPGIYPDVPHETYLQWDAASNSALSDMKWSPAHCRWRKDHPSEETAAMHFGTALHMALLEEKRFLDTYVPAPTSHGNSKQGHLDRALIAQRGLKTLKPDEFAAVRGIQARTKENATACTMLALPEPDAYHELSIVWDQVTMSGLTVQCKLRLDCIDFRTGLALDIKTTTDARKEAFKRTIYQYGYHRQAAFYVDGLTAFLESEGRDPQEHLGHFLIHACEKVPPWGVMLYDIEQTAIGVGREEYQKLLDLYGRCELKGEWPCYADGVQPIGLPPWAYSRALSSED